MANILRGRVFYAMSGSITGLHAWARGKIHFLTFEMYWSENDFYCGQSYIARYDERIRFNG